ncbi:MAG: ROK family transcriptional regulator [Clostridium sp.]|nr:ROK family transcriptional regulator [Clostridium sp.]
MAEKAKIFNTGYIREQNTSEIMRCVRKHGPISRAEIGDRTSISRSTVTRVVNHLIAEGLLEECDVMETTRGRHPVNVDIRSDALYAFGVNISKNHLSIVLTDLKTKILDKTRISIKSLSSSEELIRFIEHEILRMIGEHKLEQGRILGIGVGAPGLVDSENGVINDFALGGKMLGIPLKQELEKRLGLKVLLDNNCNTWLFGESWSGYAVDQPDTLFVLSSEGVGCGILRRGEICRELNHRAAGLGHISVNMHGERCRCGNRGCVETYCSTDMIEKKAEELLAVYRQNGALCPEITGPLTYKEVARLVDEGDGLFVPILSEAACALGCGLVSVINLYSPKLVILSGTLFDASEFYYKTVIQEVRGRLSAGVQLPEFRKRNVSDPLFEIGAATTILHELF